jgi:hypothetical protein
MLSAEPDSRQLAMFPWQLVRSLTCKEAENELSFIWRPDDHSSERYVRSRFVSPQVCDRQTDRQTDRLCVYVSGVSLCVTQLCGTASQPT